MTAKKTPEPAPEPHPISIWDFPEELHPPVPEFAKSQHTEPETETVPVKSAATKES
jgi:hypothetical protein